VIDASTASINTNPVPLTLSTGLVIEDFPPVVNAENFEPREPPSTRVLELDGVRALAIWWVVIMHVFPDSNPAVSKMPLLIRQIISHGFLGVDLFFVLSGFLITGILLESRTKRAYFKNFYGRRALRILPVYLSAIIVMWICYHGFSSFFILCLAFLANFNNLLHVPFPHGAGVFWSLAVEEHFYLVWPLLIRFTRPRTLVAIGIAVVTSEIVVRGICMARGIDTYELSWFRFDSLVFGALIAVFVRSRYCTRQNCIRLAAGLVLLAGAATAVVIPFGALSIGSPVSSTLRYAHAYVSFGACILMLWAFRGHWLTAVFRTRFARISADLSYCVYLINLGVFDAYFRLIGPWLRPWLRERVGAFGEGMASAVAILAVTFLVALLSRKFLEGPFLRLKERFV